MNLTIDLGTVLVVTFAAVAAVVVYRRTAPPADAAHQTSKGERLVLALTAAGIAIGIGGYIGDKVTSEPARDRPSVSVITEAPA
ncbi:hypothetical protein ACFU7X_25470 [Streptomyces chartreusis]|uniref:hypothetical protein n=1 Tax=Streptomyces chartreusis TaxID=1969 RepID=UPI003691C1C9